MKIIKLTQGKETLISDESFDKIKNFSWSFAPMGTGYAQGRVDGKLITLHRFITKAIRGQEVDHINGNTLDNRIENLRLCSHSQNMKNRKVNYNSRTGIKGVTIADGKYRAKIKVNGRDISLGSFLNVYEAEASCKKAANQYFGVFARV